MEPLKELFNQAYFLKLATEIKKVHQPFDEKTFLKQVTHNLSKRELNERLRHTSITLKDFLPSNFEEAVNILKQVAPNLKTGYTTLVFPDFVGLYGLQHFKFSLEALSYFTQFGSSEFAIRVFLKHDFESTIKLMANWAKSENHHVRRLASEGCRPRLPWSFKLENVCKDPHLTLPILSKLKEDQEAYVKKSVANHLNDFSKDHPEFLIKVLNEWKSDNLHTNWILKHASRTLLKQGNTKVLNYFGIKSSKDLSADAFSIINKKIRVGENLHFSFKLNNSRNKSLKVRLEYALYFKLSNDKFGKKVFKLRETIIKPKEKVKYEKKHSFKPLSTRTYNSGFHQIGIIVNGIEVERISFQLVL
jgi:3-methyladenine DNA glycosylase AlkC